jgi:Zn finger protein HypA/HybF involved in hydrogenase expression
MGVSRATFGRIIQNGRKIIADALINGKAINVEGGKYRIVDQTRIFKCKSCNHTWEEEKGTGRPRRCPQCKQNNLHRIMQD